MPPRSVTRVCVLGAGVVGLSAAVNLIEQVPEIDVTVVAEKFGTETTSNVAGGLIISHALGETPYCKIKKWITASQREALRHLRSEDCGESGVLLVPCYMAYTEKTETPPWSDEVFCFRRLESSEVEALFGRPYPTVFHFSALLWEPLKYMSWLMKRFKNAGGHTIMRKESDFQRLISEYDIVINCSGLGSHQLTGDRELVPIRGQLVQAEAPWLNFAFILNEGENYVIPGSNSIKMGGTHQYQNWDTAVSSDDKRAIVEGCSRILPGLKKAKILSDLVGLRPGRSQVRLEPENIQIDGKPSVVIHNYGHGGSGVGLSWGCAEETTQLVRECIKQRQATIHPAKL